MNSTNKPTNLDGWNDPPANLTLSDNMSTKRVLLNKRVPFTNQDLTSTNNPTDVLMVPPPTLSASATTESTDDTTSIQTELLSIEEMNEIFQKQIEKLSNVEKKILEDIMKKFQIMLDEWSQNKFSSNTKQTLSNIFQELRSNQIQQAFDLHILLVRNASSEVVRFIVGIKRLIQELQRLSS